MTKEAALALITVLAGLSLQDEDIPDIMRAKEAAAHAVSILATEADINVEKFESILRDMKFSIAKGLN